MSDISIPGVTASKYKTDELIQGLMKVERVPRDRAEKELEQYKTQQTAWRELNQHSINLRDTAKTLYSYDNPFSEKISESTNERAISAIAKREAKEQSFRISVSQIAEADSFLSSKIPAKGQVPKGTYSFAVGDKDISFSWKGGSYKDFVDSLNRRAAGLLRASIIQISSSETSLLIESLKPGAQNRLNFLDDAKQFALDIGLIKQNDSSSIQMSKTQIDSVPQSNNSIDFSTTARAKDGLVLEFKLAIHSKNLSEIDEESEQTPFIKSSPGLAIFNSIQVENADFETPISEFISKPQEPILDMNILSLKSSKGYSVPLPPLTDTDTIVEYSIPLSEYGDVNSLLINNKNTDKSVAITDIKIIDPKAIQDFIPINPISIAQDAIFKYEGIQITRATNNIDDLIPGLTLELNETTDKTETIHIKPNTELAKEAIISFVASYNRTIAEINILTQNKPEIIHELQYFSDDEITRAEEKLGLMMGDTTLVGVKNSLQKTTSSGFRAKEDTTLIMLNQLGISTKAVSGGGFDSASLRGYLEIDEKKLDTALQNSMEEVKELFGFDSDSDLVIDSGIAFSIDKMLTPYVQTGGIFPSRTNGLATKITNTEKKISQLDVQLANKEQDLKSKYGKMEGTLNSLQNQSNSITNFSQQQQK